MQSSSRTFSSSNLQRGSWFTLCALLFTVVLLTANAAMAQRMVGTVAVGHYPDAAAVNPITNKIYVANYGTNDVTVIDGATGTTSSVTVGASPKSAAVNPITNKIYIANWDGNDVTVIDGATNTTTSVGAGSSPNGVAVNSTTNKIYVTNYYSNDVTVINGIDNTTTTVAVGTTPSAMAINPITNKIYVTGFNSDSVTVIDGRTNATTTIPAPTQPFRVAVNPITNKIYVANYGSGNVTVIDGATNSTTTVSAGSVPYSVAVNPATNKVYVVNDGSNNVTVIDGATLATTTVPTGSAPASATVNTITNQIYITNHSSNNVTVIDGATNATNNVAVGSGPWQTAVNPATNRMYTTNGDSNSVTVIDGATNTTVATIDGFGGMRACDQKIDTVTNKLYALDVQSPWLLVVDGATNGLQQIPLPVGEPQALAYNELTGKLYISNHALNIVSVIDAPTLVTTATIPVSQPYRVMVNPLANKIYVAESTSTYAVYKLSVIDGKTNSVVATIDTGGYYLSGLDPTTNKIFLLDNMNDSLMVLDGETYASNVVEVGSFPNVVAVNPLTNKIYVVNSVGNTVTVIDGTTFATTSISVGHWPNTLVVNPFTNKIYVGNYDDQTFTVIDGATNATHTFAGGAWNYVQGLDPVTNKIYGSTRDGMVIIDGATNATTIVGPNQRCSTVNPVTGKIYSLNVTDNQLGYNTFSVVDESTLSAIPIAIKVQGVNDAKTIAGNSMFSTWNNTPSFTATVTSNFKPSAPPPTALYYQLDTAQGKWQKANATSSAGANPAGYSFTLSAVPLGLHHLYVIAAYGSEGTVEEAYGTTNAPQISNLQAYPFAVLPRPAGATMLTPAPGATLGGAAAAFTWTELAQATQYTLYVGSTRGAHDIAFVNAGLNTTATVTNIPTDGAAIYVTLYTLVDGKYAANSYTYTEAGAAVPATMINPGDGSMLSGSSATFTWTAGTGVSQYSLNFGSTPGAYDLGYVNAHLQTTATVNNLPTTGRPIYVRLFSWIGGKYQWNDYTYTQAGGSPASMISPAPGSSVAGTSETFTWDEGIKVSQYSLYVGTSPGKHDVAFVNAGMNKSATVSGLPNTGGALYVTLYSWIEGKYKSNAYMYAQSGTAAAATMVSPTPGSTLTGSSATFTWTAGTGVSQYSLYVGTAPGHHDLGFVNTGMQTTATVNNLPTSGGPIYVTLFSWIAGKQQSNQYTYIPATSGVKATMISPVNGSTLSGASTTFTWTPGTGVSTYSFYVGKSPGSHEYVFTPTTETTYTVTNLPADGSTVYVQLNSFIGSAWQSAGYSYVSGP